MGSCILYVTEMEKETAMRLMTTMTKVMNIQ